MRTARKAPDTISTVNHPAARRARGNFGEILRATGPMAKSNPFRFSTKYQDDETDLHSYGYRNYNASTGRWLSRDPIEENGGVNLYGFVENSPESQIDPFGLYTFYFPIWYSNNDIKRFESGYAPLRGKLIDAKGLIQDRLKLYKNLGKCCKNRTPAMVQVKELIS